MASIDILDISSLSCIGGTTGTADPKIATVELEDGKSCTLFVGADSDNVGYSGGVLSREGNVYRITAGTLEQILIIRDHIRPH